MRVDREKVGPSRAIRKAPRAHPGHRVFAAVACASHRAVAERRVFNQRMVVFNQSLNSVTLRAVETSIELRYAGVVIGKATVSGPIDESGESSVFVSVPDPLPVGTKVGLKIDDRALDGRVIAVAESSESSKCGMKIRIGGASSASKSSSGAASGSTPPVPAASAPAAVADAAPAPAASAPAAPATESAPIDGAVSAEGATDLSAAHGDGSSEGVPGGEEAGGQPGGQGGGGGRRRRRRR